MATPDKSLMVPMPGDNSPSAQLRRMQAPPSDGTWFAIARWEGRGASAGWGHPDLSVLMESEAAARKIRETMPHGGVGSRTVRITIHRGSITTTQGLR